MGKERLRILKMVAEGKITAAEADGLLSALGTEPEPDAPPSQTASPGASSGSSDAAGGTRKPKYIKVRVKSGTNDNVDIKVPLNLLRAGIRLTSLIPKPAMDQINKQLKERGVDLDMDNLKSGDFEEIIESLSELEVMVDSKNGDTVRIFCE